MTTPNLIVQHRELARSIRELRRQNEQSLDAIAAARDHEMAAAEQARLHANRQYDARLAESLELEQGARAVVKFTGAQAPRRVVETPLLMPVPDPVQTLTECKSEIERILPKLTSRPVILRFVDVPSNVDHAQVKGILQGGGERPIKSGDKIERSLRDARELIPKLEVIGIKAELVV